MEANQIFTDTLTFFKPEVASPPMTLPADYGVANTPLTVQTSSSTPHEAEGVDPDPNNRMFKAFLGVKKLPSGKIRIDKYLAEGAFGQVYRGRWAHHLVALKKIDLAYAAKKLGVAPEQIADSLEWEVSRLATTHHPNLVPFYGIYQQEDRGPIYLVMEFCEGGTLQKAVQTQVVPLATLWRWAFEITEGIEYLHSQGILHRDLKAENILLDRKGRAKLADLGVAQVDALLAQKVAQVVEQGLHDQKFIAPENLSDPKLSTPATDIYALGLLFWEMVSGKVPRKLKELSESEFNAWAWGQSMEREPIPEQCHPALKALILDCWHYDPQARPSAQDLIVRLKALAPQFTDNHPLIAACEALEARVDTQRQESLAYVPPFVTAYRVEEPMEHYWDRFEGSQETQGKKNPPLTLASTFEAFMEIPGSTTLLLLGEAGLGKTLTMHLWADQWMQPWWAYLQNPTQPKPAYLPIWINPTRAQGSDTAIDQAIPKVLQAYGLESTDIPLLVFLDGYDELRVGKEPTPLVAHLGLDRYPHAKLIVTCRPDAVKEEEHRARFALQGQLQTRYVLPFNRTQLLGYLKDQLAWDEADVENYQRLLEQSPAVREVLRNPFVLYLLKESWSIVSKKRLDQLGRSQIYAGFVEHVITTHAPLLADHPRAIMSKGYPDLVTSFQRFASHVAFEAGKNKSSTLDHAEAAQQLSSPWLCLKETVEQDARQQCADRETKLSQMSETDRKEAQKRVLLSVTEFVQMMHTNRQQFEAELPLRLRSQTYEYTHKSLFEYFVATHLADLRHVERMAEDDLESLMDQLRGTNPEILIFLHEACQEREPDEKDRTNTKLAILFNFIAYVLQDRAQYPEALRYYMQALVIWEKVHGQEHPSTGAVCNNIGNLLQAQGKFDEALRYAMRALAIFEQVHGKAHPDMIPAYNNIGMTLRDQGQSDEALRYFMQALAICEQVHGKEHPETGRAYNNIGMTLRDQGQSDEALRYAMQALAIREQVHGQEHPDTCNSYNNIGSLLQDQGQYDEALHYLMQALAICEQVHGKEHPEMGRAYNNIGNLLQAQGKSDEALHYLMQALAIVEKVHGKEHPDTGFVYNNIGSLLEAQGKSDEALRYFMQALAICEQVHGKEHPDTSVSYNNIGSLLQAQGQYDKALHYLMQALAICEQVHGKEHPKTGLVYGNIGMILKAQGKYDEALRYFMQALAICEQVHGKDHPKTFVSYANISMILKAQGQPDEALRYLMQALAICEQVHGKEHPDTGAVYHSIGMILEAQGKYDEALRYFMQALAICEQVHGKDHPKTFVSYTNISMILKAQGKYDEALRYAMQALAICEQVHGKEHPNTVMSYANIGSLLEAQGKYDEALRYIEQASAIVKKVHGKEHPDTGTVYNNIGDLSQDQSKGVLEEYEIKQSSNQESSTEENIPQTLFFAYGDSRNSIEQNIELMKTDELPEKDTGSKNSCRCTVL